MAVCYRDMSFCADADECATECWRHFTDANKKAAKEWWGDMPGEPPVAYSHFKETCEQFKRKER